MVERENKDPDVGKSERIPTQTYLIHHGQCEIGDTNVWQEMLMQATIEKRKQLQLHKLYIMKTYLG